MLVTKGPMRAFCVLHVFDTLHFIIVHSSRLSNVTINAGAALRGGSTFRLISLRRIC